MQRLSLKRKLASIWPAGLKSNKIILLYHSVGDTPWGMPIDQFERQIKWLSSNADIISTTEILNSSNSDRLKVAITFDDGYQSLVDNALPVLKKYNAAASVYLNTGWISDNISDRKNSNPFIGHYPDEKFLTWNEVNYLYQSGWEIGSHGINHFDFSQTDDQTTYHELITSRTEIENKVGCQCRIFAYPWGRHSPKLINIVKETGYDFAAGAAHGEIDDTYPKYFFPRINIDKNYSDDDFKNIILGKWDFLRYLHKFRGL